MSAPEQLYRRSTVTDEPMPLCGRPTKRGRTARRCQMVVPRPGDACVIHDPAGYRARCAEQLRAILGAAR